MTKKTPIHYQYKLKCLNCQLHFIALSWYRGWWKPGYTICPECGSTNVICLKVEQSDKQIWEIVPGITEQEIKTISEKDLTPGEKGVHGE